MGKGCSECVSVWVFVFVYRLVSWHSYHLHSAGVGRTGTLIAMDIVLEQIEKEGMVDIAGTIRKMRQQRMKMIQGPVRSPLLLLTKLLLTWPTGSVHFPP